MATSTSATLSGKPITASSEEVRVYECTILYPNDLTQKEEQELLKEVEAHWTEAGGKVVDKDAWGRRGLAYQIKGKTEGKFVVYFFEIDPSKLKEIDQALKIQRNLLRHLIVKPPKHYLIRKWSELYETWLKERETVEQQRARERETKLQEKVAAKAKREAERMDRKKAAPKAALAREQKPALEGAELTKKLEEIISDDSIENL